MRLYPSGLRYLQATFCAILLLLVACKVPGSGNVSSDQETCPGETISVSARDRNGVAYAGLPLQLVSLPTKQVFEKSTTDAHGKVSFQNVQCGDYYVTFYNGYSYSTPFLSHYARSSAPFGMFKKTESENEFKVIFPRILFSKGFSESHTNVSGNPVSSTPGIYGTQFVFQEGMAQLAGLLLGSNTKYLVQKFTPQSELRACGIGIGVTTPNRQDTSSARFRLKIYRDHSDSLGDLISSQIVTVSRSDYAFTSFGAGGTLLDLCLKNEHPALVLQANNSYWVSVEIMDGLPTIGTFYTSMRQNQEGTSYFALQSTDGTSWNDVFDAYQTMSNGEVYNVLSSSVSLQRTSDFINNPNGFVADKGILQVFIVQ